MQLIGNGMLSGVQECDTACACNPVKQNNVYCGMLAWVQECQLLQQSNLIRAYSVHSQIHDFEVEHVVRHACALSVSLQSTCKPFISIGTFRQELPMNSDSLRTLQELQSTRLDMWQASTRILPHHQLKSYGHMLGACHVVNLAV